MLRRHQREILDVCREIKRGAPITRIIAHVTPGGGKSVLPVILATELLGAYADKICWVVPRRSLQKQGEESFLDPTFRTMLSHAHSIRVATNENDPSRGLSGYVTTYAALAVDDNSVNSAEFDRRRYILVLDEPHHIAADSSYEAAIAPLVQRAKLVLFMSGTLERDDDKRIAFLEYQKNALDGSQALNLTPNAQTAVVTYPRAQALLDRAIIRLKFEHIDAAARWKQDGAEKSVESLGESEENCSAALFTALSTEFAYKLLDKIMESWRVTKLLNPRSKLLVVAARQAHAAQYQAHLEANGIRAGLATMNEGDDAQRAIERFKRTDSAKLDCLVTVAMAYEGLDCKAITHLACLTNIRSRPWIEQMLARATRFDPAAGSWQDQRATVFIPDDPIMGVLIGKIIRDDERVLPPDAVPSESEGQERIMFPIEPMSSSAGAERQSELISEDDKKALEHAMQSTGIQGVTPEQMQKAMLLAGYVPQHHIQAQSGATPSERENRIRADVEKHVRDYANICGSTPVKVNGKIKKRFKKSRSEMSLPELEVVQKWVKAKLPLNSLFRR